MEDLEADDVGTLMLNSQRRLGRVRPSQLSFTEKELTFYTHQTSPSASDSLIDSLRTK